MKKLIPAVLLLFFAGHTVVTAVPRQINTPEPLENTLFLSSSIGAFLQGDYHGAIDFATLSKQGDLVLEHSINWTGKCWL